MAPAARRRAILQGLSSLGYEVTEGMATAWVEQGRVVLRKAASPDYGVELGGGIQSDRLQVRAVAYGRNGAARARRKASRARAPAFIDCGTTKAPCAESLFDATVSARRYRTSTLSASLRSPSLTVSRKT